MKSRACLTVDLNLLKSNCQNLKALSPAAFFCPMLKANAYGHGAVPIAQALLEIGISQVGVCTLQEAWQIKEHIKNLDILVFNPILNQQDMSWMLNHNLILVCSNWQDLKQLAQCKTASRIHLKFDTGFSRLGFLLSDAKKILSFLKDHPHIRLQGLATHLICATKIGQPKEAHFLKQIQVCNKLQASFCCPLHILNTEALISYFIHDMKQEYPHLGSRPGIGLYGIKPSVFCHKIKHKNIWNNMSLFLISCLKSYIVDLRHIKQGASVSYGARWQAKQDSVIATCSIGYGDGLLRGAGLLRELLFRGNKRPVVGTVCMDFLMLDVTQDYQQKRPAKIGEEIVLFGHQKQGFLCPQKQAQQESGLIHEYFSRIGNRVQRIYKT